jgi:hypothetical protein
MSKYYIAVTYRECSNEENCEECSFVLFWQTDSEE